MSESTFIGSLCSFEGENGWDFGVITGASPMPDIEDVLLTVQTTTRGWVSVRLTKTLLYKAYSEKSRAKAWCEVLSRKYRLADEDDFFYEKEG